MNLLTRAATPGLQCCSFSIFRKKKRVTQNIKAKARKKIRGEEEKGFFLFLHSLYRLKTLFSSSSSSSPSLKFRVPPYNLSEDEECG